MSESDLDEAERQLLTAFRGKEWERCKKIVELTQRNDQIEQETANLQKQREAVALEFASLNEKEAPKQFKGRKIILPLTRGALDHKYLLVTRALADRVLSHTEKLKIHVPATGVTFDTDIYRRNKVLNERYYIGQFYKAAGVQADDFVLLDEISPGEWNLTKCDRPT